MSDLRKPVEDAEYYKKLLAELPERTKHDPGAAFEPDAVAALALLKQENPAEFERLRARLGKEGKVRRGELDKHLIEEMGKVMESPGQGQALVIDEPEPWLDSVDGTALLDDISKAISEHVILPERAADGVALWVVMTYCVDIFDCLPRLYIHSPERECGKTTLMTCVSRLAWRSMPASNISSASTFRVIEKWHPTLCLDEADTFLRENIELRGIINSGHTRAAAFVVRTVGDDHDPARFSTYTPIAIAGIGHIHDTTESRSLIIPMRRKKKGEKTTKLRDHIQEPFATLRRKILRWVKDNQERLKQCDPPTPEALSDRAADNWRPLLAIADVAGREWPERARQAAVKLSTSSEVAGMSFPTMLLADIKAIFDDRNTDKISSSDLANALASIEGRPWAEYGKQQKQITQNALARLLADFKINPGTIRISEKDTPKGYKREQFADAWERYLADIPPELYATPPQSAEIKAFLDDFEAQQDDEGGGLKTGGDTWKSTGCGVVADVEPLW